MGGAIRYICAGRDAQPLAATDTNRWQSADGSMTAQWYPEVALLILQRNGSQTVTTTLGEGLYDIYLPEPAKGKKKPAVQRFAVGPIGESAAPYTQKICGGKWKGAPPQQGPVTNISVVESPRIIPSRDPIDTRIAIALTTDDVVTTIPYMGKLSARCDPVTATCRVSFHEMQQDLDALGRSTPIETVPAMLTGTITLPAPVNGKAIRLSALPFHERHGKDGTQATYLFAAQPL